MEQQAQPLSIEKLEQEFAQKSLDQKWQQAIESSGCNESEQGQVHAWIKQYWENLLNQITQAQDRAQKNQTFINMYIETWAQQLKFNALSQYFALHTDIDPGLSKLKTSVLTELIFFMAQFLSQDQKKHIHTHIAGPEQSISPASTLDDQVSDIQEKRNQLHQKLDAADMESILSMIEDIDAQLQTLYNDLENAVVIEGKKVTIMGSRKVIIRKDAGQ